MNDPGHFHAPENFHKRQVPHESEEACKEAFSKFYDGVYELANEHRIAEVLLCGMLRADGPDTSRFMVSRIGSVQGAIDLAAVVGGYGRGLQEDRISAFADVGARAASPPAPPARRAEVIAALVCAIEEAGITPEQIAEACEEHATRRAREAIEKAGAAWKKAEE